MVGQASFVSEKLLCFAFALVAKTTPPAPSQWNGKPGTNHHRAASQRAPLGTLGTYLSKHPPVWKQKPQVPRPGQVLHSGGSKRTATRGASFSTHGPTMHVYFRTSIFLKISISCSFINNFSLSSLLFLLLPLKHVNKLRLSYDFAMLNGGVYCALPNCLLYLESTRFSRCFQPECSRQFTG